MWEKPPGPSGCRIVSWNVRSLRDDRDALVQVLRALRPDVVALQEAPRFLRSRTRLAALARQADLLFACGGRATAGTALLTSMRMDVLRQHEALLPPTPRLHRRGCALAQVRPSGSHDPGVVVASVHLGLSAEERIRHARYVRELVAAFRAGPGVVAGDLNEEAGAPAWGILAAGREDPGATGDLPTFPAREPQHRIDAVLLPPGLGATAAVRSDALVAAASDHCPVVVDVDLASGPPAALQ
jgi:endonuclease/exonuclease/phosphatase family metal-dependent hydrolase